MLHKMNIGGLAMDPSSNAPILILNANLELKFDEKKAI